MAQLGPDITTDFWRAMYGDYPDEATDKVSKDTYLHGFFQGYTRDAVRAARVRYEWHLVYRARLRFTAAMGELSEAVRVACSDNYPVDEEIGFVFDQNLRTFLREAARDPGEWLHHHHNQFLVQLRTCGTNFTEYAIPPFENPQIIAHYKSTAINVWNTLLLHYPVQAVDNPQFLRLISPIVLYPLDWPLHDHMKYVSGKMGNLLNDYEIRNQIPGSTVKFVRTHHRKVAVRIFETIRHYIL